MQDDFGNHVHHPTMGEMWMRMDQLQKQLDENTESTKRTEENTSELIQILNSLKSAFRVLSWIGNLAKPLGAIVGLGLGIWGVIQAFKTGVMPK